MNICLKIMHILFAIVPLGFLLILLGSHCPTEADPPEAKLTISNTSPNVGENVTLNGTNSTGTDISYQWGLLSSPPGSQAAITGQNEAVKRITPDLPGDYVIKLLVTDNQQRTDDAQGTITASAAAYLAFAGPDRFAHVGDTISLDGSNSSGQPLAYSWSFLQKPSFSSAAISNPTNSIARFVMDEPGVYQAELEINVVNTLLADKDTVVITSYTPDISGFSPNSGQPGTAVEIYGINFSSHLSGDTVKFNGITAPLTSASGTELITEVPAGATTGRITVKITETGESAISASDFVVLELTANAGPDATADAGTTVILDGSNSQGPAGQLVYQWRFLGRPTYSTAAISNSTSAIAQFIMDEPGVYDVELELGLTGTTQVHKDQVQITSNPPRIFSFNPGSGPAGTPVTIVGKNFSPTPARNSVLFNNYVAQVTSAANTQLIAEVPQMATSGPITVRLPETGESAVTAQDFTVTIVGSPWTPVASVGQTLSGVTFADNSNGIVVGNLGTAYRTTDGGFTWSPLNTGTSEPLMDVSFANMNIGYAVGENGTVLRTADFGDNWASINGVTTRDLYGVSTPDDSTVFVAGQAGSVLRSIDNGITWQAVNTGGQTNYDIWFATKDTGFVATQQGQVKSTFNGGQTWTNRYNRASGEFFQAISFADMLTGLAVGTPGIGEIVKTVDGGLTWSPQSSGTTEILRGVSVFSGDPQIGIAVGDNGTVFRTTDGGLNWTQENSGVSENLRAVCIIDANVAIIVGSFGTVFRRE